MLWLMFAVITVLNLLDCIMTWVAIRRYGARELNPLARFMFRHFGMLGAAIIKMAAMAAISLVFVFGHAPLILFELICLFLMLTGWNAARLRIHRRRWQRACSSD